MKRRGELAETGVEAERQRGQYPVPSMILKIQRHAPRAGDHVAVGQHHPFGHASAARGVKNRGHVGVDCAVRLQLAGVRQRIFPSHDIRPHYGFGLATDYNHRAQIVTFSQNRCKEAEPFNGGNEDTDVAILEDVRDLVRLQQRVDRHKYAACGGGAKQRDHSLQALFEIDRDAFRATQSQVQ